MRVDPSRRPIRVPPKRCLAIDHQRCSAPRLPLRSRRRPEQVVPARWTAPTGATPSRYGGGPQRDHRDRSARMPSRLGRGDSASFAPNEAGSVLLSVHLAAARRRGIDHGTAHRRTAGLGPARRGAAARGCVALASQAGNDARQCRLVTPGFFRSWGSTDQPNGRVRYRWHSCRSVALVLPGRRRGRGSSGPSPESGRRLPGPAQARRMTVTSTDQAVTCPPGRRFRSASSTTPSAAHSKSIHTSSVPGSAARSSTPEARGRTAVARHDPRGRLRRRGGSGTRTPRSRQAEPRPGRVITAAMPECDYFGGTCRGIGFAFTPSGVR